MRSIDRIDDPCADRAACVLHAIHAADACYVSSVGSMPAEALRSVGAGERRTGTRRDEGTAVSHRTTTISAHSTSVDVNFLDLDLNLLIALDALLGEQSVTRARRCSSAASRQCPRRSSACDTSSRTTCSFGSGTTTS